VTYQQIFRGPYKFTRTPLYMGALVCLGSEALFFQSVTLVLMTGGIFVVFHLFAILREEPMLRTKYQTIHQQYCTNVPRWLPRVVTESVGLAKYDF
jgi:protein-S-isoprenylcysteine O-methyltransferase Ste14